MKKLIVPRRRLITRRSFVAAAPAILLGSKAFAACLCTAGGNKFVDSGRAPFWGINFTSYVNASGTDGPYGSGVTDSVRYDQAACDNVVGDLSQMKFDAVAVQIMPQIVNGSDTFGAGPRTETRAGIRRACNNVVNAGMTLYVKVQPEPNGNFNRTTQYQPATPAGLGANYKTWVALLLDDIEANLPTGKHVRGICLFSECDQLCSDTYKAMFTDIRSFIKNRYPFLQIVVIMPTFVGGTGFGGYARMSAGLRQVFDADCSDVYLPTRIDSEAGPLTVATYTDRYSNAAANHAHGGPGDFIANNAPPVGLQGTSLTTFINGNCAADNLKFIDFELGCPASVDSSHGAVNPASDGFGNAATANGCQEQVNYLTAAVTEPNTNSTYAGVFFHEISSLDDLIAAFFNTDGFRLQQMKRAILLILQQTGGSYGTFSPSNQGGSPPRGLSFVVNS